MRIKTDIPIYISEIAQILKSDFNSDSQVNAICTNSRNCENGDLFFALKGENFDGGDFIVQAKSKGAHTVANRINADFLVIDAYKALLSVASRYKQKINPKYTVAVTGSIGKTTVKDFI